MHALTPTLAALLVGLASPWLPAPGEAPGLGVDDLRFHYERVETELSATDVTHLTEEQRDARLRAIALLREYRRRGDFGRNTQLPGARLNLFVDDGGRRCAVAEILHGFGRDDVVARVAGADNHVFVAELAGDPEFRAWLDAVGLSIEEAARIQGPGWNPVPRVVPDEYDGPRDTPPAPTPSSRPQPSTPSAPAASSPATPAGAAPAPPALPQNPTTPGTATNHEVGAEAWWTWWELHKLDYLRPNLIRNWVSTVTGWSDGSPARTLLLLREELTPILTRDLERGSVEERCAAAIALGRIAGAEAVPALTAALEDPSALVRERAILALGANATREAAHVLLTLAKSGKTAERAGRTNPDARFLAIVALGVAKRNGLNADVDQALHGILADVKHTERRRIHSALACFQTLSDSSALDEWAVECASDDDAPVPVRCRALESLRFADDDESLRVLLHALGGPRLELRRSAALALGEMDNPLAAQPLLTACELEKEPLALAFALVSTGRRGGAESRDFLVHYLQKGRKTHRPWTALGLGILARRDDDDEARAVLRERFRSERNQNARGAWYLAMGIAGDEKALPILTEGLFEGATPETRSAAAFGLAMVGTEEARQRLRQRLETDPCPYTRSAICQALGYMGDPRDAQALIDTLRDLGHPELQSLIALALGLHGTRASLDGLVEIVRSSSASPSARAAAIEAVQLLVGRGPNLTLSELLRQSNFAVFPAPLVRHMQVPI